MGPLPCTKKGHQILLPVKCSTVRYPQGFPLKVISTEVIVITLNTIFLSVGIPPAIQSDQGSNFTSKISEVLKEPGKEQNLSSVHHPESESF